MYIKGQIKKHPYYELNYSYLPKEITDMKILNLEEKINNVFKNFNFRDNLVDIITCIRGIMKDYTEEVLNICVKTENGISVVNYKNGELKVYERINTIKNPETNEKLATIRVSTRSETMVNIRDINFENINKTPSVIGACVNSMLERYHKLPIVEEPKFNSDDKTLIEAYKIFYGTNIDVSDKYLETKIQAMCYLLQNCGFTVGSNDNFIGFKVTENGPESLFLKSWIYSLVPKIEYYNYEKDKYFNEDITKQVNKLGREIRKLVKTNEIGTSVSELINFCNIHLIKKFYHPFQEEQEILKAEYVNCSDNEAQKHFALMRKLEENYPKN